MKKINYGKKSLHSIEIQLTAILQNQFGGADIEIIRIRPHRSGRGNYLWVVFHISTEPDALYNKSFAVQRIGKYTDVWLENSDIHPINNIKKQAA